MDRPKIRFTGVEDESIMVPEELLGGKPLWKVKMDYYDDCDKKFKKKIKLTDSRKRRIIEEVLIFGFHEFLEIAKKHEVDDDCVAYAFFFIQGLRDSIKTDAILKRDWKDNNEVEKQVINMIKTFSFYLNYKKTNKDISTLINKIVERYRKKTNINLSDYGKAPKPTITKVLLKTDFFKRILKFFIHLEDEYLEKKTYPKPRLLNSRKR